ncbi:unnamed protein product [Calypogeia fissa]
MSLHSSESPSDGSSAMGVHDVAAKGFNTDSQIYESARPSYPAAAVAHLQTQLGLIPSQSHVVDLAAGSGKFTRLLLPQKYHLIAVEPSQSMRDVFTQVLPTIPILEGTGSSIPVEDGSQDAVVVAQAFHWFANMDALKEIHRVLKPHGKLGLIWNLEDRNSAKWVASLRQLYEKYEMGTPQYRLGIWREVWGTEEAKKLFTELQEAQFQHVQLCTEDVVWGRVASKSYVACRSDEEKETLRAQVLEVLRSAEDVERDPAIGLVKYPYQTYFVWCEKLEN